MRKSLSEALEVSRDIAETALALKPKVEILDEQLRVFKEIANHAATIAGLSGDETAALRLSLSSHMETLEQATELDTQLMGLPSEVQGVLVSSVKAAPVRKRRPWIGQ